MCIAPATFKSLSGVLQYSFTYNIIYLIKQCVKWFKKLKNGSPLNRYPALRSSPVLCHKVVLALFFVLRLKIKTSNALNKLRLYFQYTTNPQKVFIHFIDKQ